VDVFILYVACKFAFLGKCGTYSSLSVSGRAVPESVSVVVFFTKTVDL
jgi:hypothetical protein